jgi:peptidoglycan/LPS O-acetylase OafA/YrhL
VGCILALSYGNAIYQALRFAHGVSLRYHQPLHAPVVAGVITVIFAVMTLIALRVTRRLGRPWFAAAGALTYPLYLVHAYAGFVLISLLAPVVSRWVLVPAMIVFMGAVACAIHRLIEVRLGPRLRRGLIRLSGAAATRRAGTNAE